MTPEEEQKLRDMICSLMTTMFDKVSPEASKHMSLKDASRRLEKNKKDIHWVIGPFKNGFNEENVQQALQKALDDGYQKGLADAGGRHATAKPPPADAKGINGYSWKQIITHCVRHQNKLANPFQKKYVKDVAAMLPKLGGVPTAEQAEKLRDIFIERFGGKI